MVGRGGGVSAPPVGSLPMPVLGHAGQGLAPVMGVKSSALAPGSGCPRRCPSSPGPRGRGHGSGRPSGRRRRRSGSARSVHAARATRSPRSSGPALAPATSNASSGTSVTGYPAGPGIPWKTAARPPRTRGTTSSSPSTRHRRGSRYPSRTSLPLRWRLAILRRTFIADASLGRRHSGIIARMHFPTRPAKAAEVGPKLSVAGRTWLSRPGPCVEPDRMFSHLGERACKTYL